MEKFTWFLVSLVCIIVSFTAPATENVESVACGICGLAIVAAITVIIWIKDKDDLINLISFIFVLISLLILAAGGLAELFVVKHFNFMPTIYVGYAALTVGLFVVLGVKIKSMFEEEKKEEPGEN